MAEKASSASTGADHPTLVDPTSSQASSRQPPDSILLVVAGAGNARISTVIPTVAPMFHTKEIAPPVRSGGR